MFVKNALLVLTLACSSLVGDEWVRYGSNVENTHSSSQGPAKALASSLDRSQTFQPAAYFPFVNTEPSISSQIVSKGNSIFYGDWAGAVVRKNAETGAIEWRTQLPVAGGRVQSTPLIDKTFIYVIQYDSTVLHKLNLQTGEILSSTRLTPVAENAPQVHKATGSPSLARVNGTKLIIQGLDSDQSSSYLLDGSGNVVLNEFGAPAEKYTDNITIPGQQLFTAVGQIVAVNANSGEVVWRTAASANSGEFGLGIWSTAAIDEENGLAYIGSAQSYNPPASMNASAILKISLETGEILDRFSFIPTPITRAESGIWSAAYPAGDPAIPTASDPNGSDRDAAYYAEAYQTGNLGGDNDVGSAPVLYTAQINGMQVPVVAAQNKAGRVRAFNRNSGEMLWEQVVSDSQGSIFGNPGICYDNGVIYVSAANDFTSYPRRGLDLSVPNVDPLLFSQFYWTIFKVNTTKLAAIDAATGQRLWQNEPVILGHPLSAPSISNGVLYTAGINGKIQAFDAATGLLIKDLGQTFPLYQLPDFSDPDIPFCFDPSSSTFPCDQFPVLSSITNSITFLKNGVFVGSGFGGFGIGAPDGGVFKYTINGK